MKGYYFIYTLYQNGRISIRDRPYPTLAAAKIARRQLYRHAKLQAIRQIRIGYQYGIPDPKDIDIKNHI